MCGIVYTEMKIERGAGRKTWKKYKQQAHRGKEGYGAVTIDGNVFRDVYRSEDEEGIKSIREDNATCILFHHRFPTSTPNLEDCTHPIYVSNKTLEYDYYVVHNGVISNASILRSRFEAIGFEYTTVVQNYYKTKNEIVRADRVEKFNDSESLAIDLAIAIEENDTKIQSEGSIAFVALQICKDSGIVNKVYFGHNDRSPLILSDTNECRIISSEGGGKSLATNMLFSMDIGGGLIDNRALQIGTTYITPSVKPYTPPESTLPLPYAKVSHSIKPKDSDKPIICWLENGYLSKTRISKEALGVITLNEWKKYFSIVADIEALNAIQRENMKMSEPELQVVRKEYFELSDKLRVFNSSVNHRAMVYN